MGRGYASRVRVAAALTLLLVLTAVAVALLDSGRSEQRLRLVASNAGQLVKGNLVKIGGTRAGIVQDIDLDDRNRAVIDVLVDDPDVVPLHHGTRAEIRLPSLSSVAGRYVSLLPGPNDRPALADGATITAADVSSPVELDQLLAALDGDARRSLQAAFRGSAAIYRGKAAAANAGLRALNPAITEMAATASEVARDDARVERLVVEAAATLDVLAGRNDEVDHAISGAADTADALAAGRQDLEVALARAPAALRQARATVSRLASAGRQLRPTLRATSPLAPRVARLLRTVDELLPAARPALRSVVRLAPLAASALRRLPQLDTAARPAFAGASSAIRDAGPIVAGARAYVPDIVHGAFQGFGGQTFGYYDANGHYGRVRPMIYGGSTQTTGALSSLLQTSVGGRAERRGLLRRCPGAAGSPAPDLSNPFQADGVDCDRTQIP